MKRLFRKSRQKKGFEIGYASDRGIKRQSSPNQDSLTVLIGNKKKDLPVLIIADGMGGYTGGAKASEMIIQAFKASYQVYYSVKDFRRFCELALSDAHEKMQILAEKDDQYVNMGSTVVVTSILDDKIELMNIGDSRAYLIHLGEMQQINYDHSFVGEAVRAGLVSREEALQHPKKNQLTQSVSARRTELKPFYNQLTFDVNDILLLCSDGLWGVVPESMIQAVVTELEPQKAAEKLIKIANAQGGPDNISVAICRRSDARPFNPFLEQKEQEN